MGGSIQGLNKSLMAGKCFSVNGDKYQYNQLHGNQLNNTASNCGMEVTWSCTDSSLVLLSKKSKKKGSTRTNIFEARNQNV